MFYALCVRVWVLVVWVKFRVLCLGFREDGSMDFGFRA